MNRTVTPYIRQLVLELSSISESDDGSLKDDIKGTGVDAEIRRQMLDQTIAPLLDDDMLITLKAFETAGISAKKTATVLCSGNILHDFKERLDNGKN